MPSTIKMIAVVDGKETTVGRCHPGQARILRKQGLAEWKDGKLVFHQAPMKEPDAVSVLEKVEAHSEPIPIERLEAAFGNVQRRVKIDRDKLREMGWKGTQNFERPLDQCPTRQLAIEAVREIREEVDPEHVVTGAFCHPFYTTGGSRADRYDLAETRTVDNLDEFLHQMYTRREAGHVLWAYDEVYERVLGFVDTDEDLAFEVSVQVMAETTKDPEWDAPTWPPGADNAREHLRSYRGRQEMVGMPVIEFDDGEEGLLEDLWGPMKHDESGPLPSLADLLPDVGPPANEGPGSKSPEEIEQWRTRVKDEIDEWRSRRGLPSSS